METHGVEVRSRAWGLQGVHTRTGQQGEMRGGGRWETRSRTTSSPEKSTWEIKRNSVWQKGHSQCNMFSHSGPFGSIGNTKSVSINVWLTSLLHLVLFPSPWGLLLHCFLKKLLHLNLEQKTRKHKSTYCLQLLHLCSHKHSILLRKFRLPEESSSTLSYCSSLSRRKLENKWRTLFNVNTFSSTHNVISPSHFDHVQVFFLSRISHFCFLST